jgi:hypothetical protein
MVADRKMLQLGEDAVGTEFETVPQSAPQDE